MKVRLSSEARRDLIAIGDYIARDNPSRAHSFIKELTDKCASLADIPLGHAIVPRYEARGIRRCVHDNYQVFYRVDGDLVFVVRVLHSARDHEALL
ncbi:type II toxin-antitoxin system RelE/ParE family toxin [Bosea sp. NPDC003192]|uniref:type II toxin-antitoxin system RelE/ParE family toxin n=1 Tax=Bosea sp. NPDC003192 TaxID=3390551 RepID=UPI003D03BC8C